MFMHLVLYGISLHNTMECFFHQSSILDQYTVPLAAHPHVKLAHFNVNLSEGSSENKKLGKTPELIFIHS